MAPDPHTPHPTPHTPSFSGKPRLLIVEDDEDLRTQMKWALAQDFEVMMAQDRESALKVFAKSKPDVVMLDLGLPPQPASVEEGFAVLSEILTMDASAKIIVITGRAEKEYALKAVADGAYDFLHKPVVIDELKVVLKRAIYLVGLEREYRKIQKDRSHEGFQGMLGESPQMKDIFNTIKKVAASDVPVLIMGGSGTGKELVASAIHNLSDRKNNSFIPINCAAIPESLIESELFGHEKGAFTGAHVQRKGKIEMAGSGTLFLDEIGELPLPLQVKLLRFLQEKVVERIGGRELIPVDARVIAATNKDLKGAMDGGSFREDLYFRIGVVTIQLPLLREREGDILLLSQAFLSHYAKESKKRIAGFTRGAINALEKYTWPGNVRELENKIRRAVVMAEGAKVTPEDLEIENEEEGQFVGLKEAREALEKKMVLNALARNQDSISKTADELGVSRPTLYDLMNKFGIKR